MAVQALMAQAAVEAFDVRVLNGFARLNEPQLDVCVRGPRIEGATPELGPIVEREAHGRAALSDHMLQRLDHRDAGQAKRSEQRLTLVHSKADRALNHDALWPKRKAPYTNSTENGARSVPPLVPPESALRR